MSRKLSPWLITVAAIAMTVGTAATASADPVQDPLPIFPNQHFEGLVNGKTQHAVIVTGHCLATTLGLFAHPIPGQYVEAVPDANGGGFTGKAGRSIDVHIPGPPELVNPPVVLGSFFVRTPIPVSLVVPCSGPGTVTFEPKPTSKTAVTDTVKVTFLPELTPTPAP